MKLIIWFFVIFLYVKRASSEENPKSPFEALKYKEVTDEIYSKIDVLNSTDGSNERKTSLAEIGQFPYQVFFQTVSLDGTFFCDGTVGTSN